MEFLNKERTPGRNNFKTSRCTGQSLERYMETNFENARKEIINFIEEFDRDFTEIEESFSQNRVILRLHRKIILSSSYTKIIIEICDKNDINWYIDYQKGMNTIVIYK